MTWKVNTVVVPPRTLDRLCASGHAVLGPGPRGVTIVTKDWLGKELVVKYLVLGITEVYGRKAIKLARRRWEE